MRHHRIFSLTAASSAKMEEMHPSRNTTQASNPGKSKNLIVEKSIKASTVNAMPNTELLRCRLSLYSEELVSLEFIINRVEVKPRRCRWWDSNPHEDCSPTDFKSVASAIPPHRH